MVKMKSFLGRGSNPHQGTKSRMPQGLVYNKKRSDLLYSMGNSTQSSVMAYMGKESKKSRYTYKCIADSLLYISRSNTTL